jgi:hypothetical protein
MMMRWQWEFSANGSKAFLAQGVACDGKRQLKASSGCRNARWPTVVATNRTLVQGRISLTITSASTIAENVGRWRHSNRPDDSISDASIARLRPVLMAALVASFGFVPMALNTGIFSKLQRPVVTVMSAGMVSSTLLTLVVLPALSCLAHAREPNRKQEETTNAHA